MARKTPLTLRIEPELHARLKFLSGTVEQSMNDVASTAIEVYLRQLGAEVVVDLERTLARVRALEDPGWESAIANFARAEVEHDDPAEGEVVDTTEDLTESQMRVRAVLAGG